MVNIRCTILLLTLMVVDLGCKKESDAANTGSRYEALFALIDEADTEQSALTRCLRYPSPDGYDWPRDLLKALCADQRTPVAQADRVRQLIDQANWSGLHSHYATYLKRHHAGDDPELLLYRAFPISSWASEGEADAYTGRWLKAKPDDPYANMLRAKFRLEQAWTLRGHEVGANVPSERMQQVIQSAEDAERLARRAILREPRLMPAYQVLQETAALAGAPEDLTHALQDAIQQSPHTYYLRFTALVLSQPQWGGTIEQCTQLVHEAQRHYKKNPRVVLLRSYLAAQPGHHYSKQRQFGPALDIYRQALAMSPQYDTVEAAAVAAQETGHHAEAAMYWSQALRFTRDPVRVLTQRGIAWESMSELPRSLRDYVAAMKMDEKNADLPYRMGLIEHKRQNFDAAELHYMKALQLAPHHEGALVSATRMWVHLKQNPRKAKPYAERLTQLKPEDPEAWLLLANILHALGDAETSVAGQHFLDLASPEDPRWKDSIAHVRRYLEQVPQAPVH